MNETHNSKLQHSMSLINDGSVEHRGPISGVKQNSSSKQAKLLPSQIHEHIERTKGYLKHMNNQDFKQFVNFYGAIGVRPHIDNQNNDPNKNLRGSSDSLLSISNKALHKSPLTNNRKIKKRYNEEPVIPWQDVNSAKIMK